MIAVTPDLLAADREARRAARTVFDRPLVVEAGAGTGKTTNLIARLLAWSLGPGWEATATALSGPPNFPSGGRPADDAVAARLLDRVVAITFTEAAAAEMGTKTAGALAALAAGDAPATWLAQPGEPLAGLDPDLRRRRAAALLAALDRLRVSTIHAFCLGLLAAHPLEAGLHPALTVDADGRLAEGAVTEVVEVALRDAYADPPDPDLLDLAGRGLGPPELVQALIELLAAGVPAAALHDDGGDAEASAEFLKRLTAAARAVHDFVAPRLRHAGRVKKAFQVKEGLAKLLSGLEPLATSGSGATGRSPLGSGTAPQALAAALPSSPYPAPPPLSSLLDAETIEAVVDKLREWRKPGRSTQTEEEAFADCRAELAAAAETLKPLIEHAARLDPALLATSRRVLGRLLGQVEGELRRRGVVTFHDLLARAAALLAARPDVAARERRRIDQLLVDEFQDTDRLQCEVVARLALDGPAGERPSLFLVGDPKQSIYGWRNADLAAYEAFLGRVRELGGTLHPLVENFRSAPPILAEVARAVAPVMIPEEGLQPAFAPLVACARRESDPGFTAGGRGPVEYWVSWSGETGPDTASDDAVALEAEAVARDVVALHRDHGVAWSEIGLLLRAATDLDAYLEALRRHGVPFAVARDRQYYRRREVIEAAALVRAVVDPGDHVALLTVLRSPMVGVPDAALIPLWRRELPRHLTALSGDPQRDAPTLATIADAATAAAAELPEGIPGLAALAGWDASLAAAAAQLSAARAALADAAADRFVEALRRLFLPEPLAAARYLGAYRLANLERFFARLAAVVDRDAGDTAAMLRTLRKSVADALDAEEARPAESAEGAVQVMTIHTAKGLDFGHVYLLQAHRASGQVGEPRIEAGRVDDRWELRLFGAATSGFDRVEARARQVEAAERVRTLYVALTRAKDRLVVAGAWAEGSGRTASVRPPAEAETYLQLLAHRADRPELGLAWALKQKEEGELDREREQGAGLGASVVDEAGVLWRFPGLDARLAGELARPGEAGAGEQPPELPGAAAVAAAAQRLAERRARAAARAARRTSAAASEEAHERLRELATERDEEQTAERGARTAAMAAGAAVHRALELADLTAERGAELERLRSLLSAYLESVLPPESAERGEALRRAEEIFDRFAAGPLAAKLWSLAGAVVAREVPVLLAPPEDPEEELGGRMQTEAEVPAAAPPVGFVSGAIDLLYREGDGGWVVADFKTDQATTESELAERARAYAPQGAVYVRAVMEALGLAAPPRFELWFLEAGRVLEAGSAPADRPSGDNPSPTAPVRKGQLRLFGD